MKITEDFRPKILPIINKYLASFTINLWETYNKNSCQFSNANEQEDTIGMAQASLDKLLIKASTNITLITHPDMAKVWKKIATLTYEHPESDFTYGCQFIEYTDNIQEALSGGSYWERLPAAQRKNEYEELIENLKKVADTISKINHHDIAKGSHSYVERLKLEMSLSDGSVDASLFYKIPNMLHLYAETLQKDQRQKNVVIDRPNSNDAPVSYFARSLYTAHRRNFGTPLYGIISTIAGIFYPDHDTSSEKIRASIRAMK